jgi:hypothetical protein
MLAKLCSPNCYKKRLNSTHLRFSTYRRNGQPLSLSTLITSGLFEASSL